MYYRINFLALLLVDTFTIHAMESPEYVMGRHLYRIPVAHILKERLEQGYFNHFSEHTLLIENVANKILTVKEIMSIVRAEISRYCDYMIHPKVELLMNKYKRKLQLYEALLTDERALEEVKSELKRYEPINAPFKD